MSKKKIIIFSLVVGFLLNLYVFEQTSWICVQPQAIYGRDGVADFMGETCFGWPLEISTYTDSRSAAVKFVADFIFWSFIVWLVLFAFDKFRNKKNNLIKTN